MRISILHRDNRQKTPLHKARILPKNKKMLFSTVRTVTKNIPSPKVQLPESKKRSKESVLYVYNFKSTAFSIEKGVLRTPCPSPIICN